MPTKKAIEPSIRVSSSGLIFLEWCDNEEQKSLPLHPANEEDFPGMSIFIMESKIVYVGPLTAFPNEHTIRKVVRSMKAGPMAWFVYCVIPFADQERPFRLFPMEIADIGKLKYRDQLPPMYYEPEIINRTIRFGYDRLG